MLSYSEFREEFLQNSGANAATGLPDRRFEPIITEAYIRYLQDKVTVLESKLAATGGKT